MRGALPRRHMEEQSKEEDYELQEIKNKLITWLVVGGVLSLAVAGTLLEIIAFQQHLPSP